MSVYPEGILRHFCHKPYLKMSPGVAAGQREVPWTKSGNVDEAMGISGDFSAWDWENWFKSPWEWNIVTIIHNLWWFQYISIFFIGKLNLMKQKNGEGTWHDVTQWTSETVHYWLGIFCQLGTWHSWFVSEVDRFLRKLGRHVRDEQFLCEAAEIYEIL